VKRTAVAAVLFELNEPLRLLELEIPPLQAGQVLVQMASSGVCHSQLLEVRGKRGPDRFLPHALGHEGVGTVTEVGPNVDKVKPGQRVVVSWIRGRGEDVPSTCYASAAGAINSGAVATFMTHTVTCESRLTPIPKRLPAMQAALLGCALPTGAGVVVNAGVEPGNSVAIFGVGGIGLSAILAAAALGAAPVIAVDLVEQKLEWARRAGATHVLNAAQCDPAEGIQGIVPGGVDYAFEAAGSSRAMEAAFASVRDAGGRCLLAGNLPAGQRISIDPFALIRGKRIEGTWGGATQPDRDIPRYERMAARGKLRLDAFPTKTYRLEDVNLAFDDLERGLVGRALLDLQS
jgi:S-(hydroxymethyl)glutathione dehydrogenase/alcohol dehydrogenase